MKKTKRYRVEIILGIILMLSLAVFFRENGKKNSKSNSESSTSEETVKDEYIKDGLYIWQESTEYVDDLSFYEKVNYMTKTEFLKHQVGVMGQKISHAEAFWNSIDYEKGGVIPWMSYTIQRVVITPQYKNQTIDNGQYMVVYLKIENNSRLSCVYDRGVTNYKIRDVGQNEAQDGYVKGGYNCYDYTEHGYDIYPDQELKGVIRGNVDIGEKEYKLSDPGDPNMMYIEPNSVVTCKFVIRVPEEQIENKTNDLVFQYYVGDGYSNNDFAILIPRDRIERVESLE